MPCVNEWKTKTSLAFRELSQSVWRSQGKLQEGVEFKLQFERLRPSA